jgi:hypothetical protein
MNAFARFMTMVIDSREKNTEVRGVPFTDFMDTLHSQVHEFKIHWAEQHLANPEVYPAQLDSEAEWTEQFIMWMGTR